MQRHRIPLAVLSALTLTLAACSGSGSDDDLQVASLTGDSANDEANDGEAVDPDEAFLEFAECMRDNDVPMEDPGSGGGFVSRSQGDDGEASANVNGVEVDPEVFDAAQEACEHLLDDAIANRQMDPAEVAEMQDQMYEFGECMRDHGIDWEDPVISADGGRVTMRSGSGPEGDPGGGPSGPGGNQAQLEDPEAQAAMEECSQSVGGGMFGGEGGGFRIGGPSGPEDRDNG